jgi:hypothetical protein
LFEHDVAGKPLHSFPDHALRSKKEQNRKKKKKAESTLKMKPKKNTKRQNYTKELT